MENSFDTFNQFSSRFSSLGKFSGDRTACPLFSLLTLYNFMNNGDISKDQHQKNVCSSIMNYVTNESIPKYLDFDELLIFAQGIDSSVTTTSSELIAQGILGYNSILKPDDYKKDYGVIILKNRNYISLLVKWNGTGYTFSIRDSHEKTQYNFPSIDALRAHLNNTYRMEQDTIVGGVPIPEYNNVEFLVIDKPFSIVNIDAELFDDNITSLPEEVSEEIKSQPADKTQLELDEEMARALQYEDQNEDYSKYV